MTVSEETWEMLAADGEVSETDSETSGPNSHSPRCLIGYADSERIIKALEMGGSLGDGKLSGEYTLEDIDPATLKLHFDSCISADLKHNEKYDMLVTFDYGTLLPTSKYSPSDDKDVSNPSEIVAVKAMTKIPALHHLLTHPLISSLIYLKWGRMKWFFSGNLFIVGLFFLTLALHICLSHTRTVAFYLITILLIISYLVIIIRESFQITVSKLAYFSKTSNILELLMLVVTFVVVFIKSVPYYKELCASSILLAVLQLGMLAKRHPQLSIPIIMLRTVTNTFFYFLSWYSILLLGFVLGFYKLFGTLTKDEEENGQSFISGIGLTFFEVFIKLTGELNASTMDLSTWAHRLFFLFFIFMIPIVLLNLLCGLAVCDTDTIREKSEILGYVETVKYISNTEVYLAGIANILSKIKYLSGIYNYFRKNFYQPMFLYPYLLPDRRIDALIYQELDSRFCLGKKTVARAKQFLAQNEDGVPIITKLKQISENRKRIRGLIASDRETVS